MARDKISSNVTEAAICEEEHSASPTTQIIAPPGKKKVLCKRGGDVAGGGGCVANGSFGTSNRGAQKVALVSSSGKAGSAGARGNKTLGWFLNDDLFENSNKISVESPSLSSAETKTEVTAASLNERSQTNKTTMCDDGKKRGKRSRQRQVKKTVENKAATVAQVTDESSGGKNGSKIDYGKEDYWYYDPTSKGYYYEQMGSRGWRRHSPAAEQKRLQMEQEMYAKFWREAAGVQMPQFDPAYNSNPSANQQFYANAQPQVKYDAESDGYFFEMPSVDGWKKRQPNSNSSSSASSNGSASKCVTNYSRAVFPQVDEERPLSYGAALARGQLPPAYTVAPNVAYLPEPFSSDTSSMTTLSEGTPTPPPRGYYGLDGIAEQDRVENMLAVQYDNALKLDDAFAPTMVTPEINENGVVTGIRNDSHLLSKDASKKQVTSYADVAAASCAVKGKKKDLTFENLVLNRPANLQLDINSLNNEDGKVNEYDVLLNFNADKFISDLLSCCPNPQRFMRDLAALKTPVAATPVRMFSVETPLAPVNEYDLRSAWPTVEAKEKTEFAENAWYMSSLKNERHDPNDIWNFGSSVDYPPSGKSKLSMWCNDNLLSSTLVDK